MDHVPTCMYLMSEPNKQIKIKYIILLILNIASDTFMPNFQIWLDSLKWFPNELFPRYLDSTFHSVQWRSEGLARPATAETRGAERARQEEVVTVTPWPRAQTSCLQGGQKIVATLLIRLFVFHLLFSLFIAGMTMDDIREYETRLQNETNQKVGLNNEVNGEKRKSTSSTSSINTPPTDSPETPKLIWY